MTNDSALKVELAKLKVHGVAAESMGDEVVRSSVSRAIICAVFGVEKISESVCEGCSTFACQVFGKG